MDTVTFYTYLWLREDGTPYYAGKGKGKRAFTSAGHKVKCPKDRNRIILQEWFSEDEAFVAEKFLISYYGRKNLATGPLHNELEGGQQPPSQKGAKRSRETCVRISLSHKGLDLSHLNTPEVKLKRTASYTGYKHRDESRKRMSLAKKGRPPVPGAARGLELGRHNRWHVWRGVVNAECSLCQ